MTYFKEEDISKAITKLIVLIEENLFWIFVAFLFYWISSFLYREIRHLSVKAIAKNRIDQRNAKKFRFDEVSEEKT